MNLLSPRTLFFRFFHHVSYDVYKFIVDLGKKMELQKQPALDVLDALQPAHYPAKFVINKDCVFLELEAELYQKCCSFEDLVEAKAQHFARATVANDLPDDQAVLATVAACTDYADVPVRPGIQ